MDSGPPGLDVNTCPVGCVQRGRMAAGATVFVEWTRADP